MGDTVVKCLGCNADNTDSRHVIDSQTCMMAMEITGSLQQAGKSYPGIDAYAEYIRNLVLGAFADGCADPTMYADNLGRILNLNRMTNLSDEVQRIKVEARSAISQIQGCQDDLDSLREICQRFPNIRSFIDTYFARRNPDLPLTNRKDVANYILGNIVEELSLGIRADVAFINAKNSYIGCSHWLKVCEQVIKNIVSE